MWPDFMISWVKSMVKYVSHMQPMVLVYLPTKPGDFGQGQMLVNIPAPWVAYGYIYIYSHGETQSHYQMTHPNHMFSMCLQCVCASTEESSENIFKIFLVILFVNSPCLGMHKLNVSK